VPVGGNTNGYDGGRRGVVLRRPHSVNKMVPIFAVQRGALIENLQIHYPDVVSRLDSEAYEIDASSYPTITGSPEAYAPAIVTRHDQNDDGSTSTGENVGGVILRNIGLMGAYDGIFCGDADPALETWATDYCSTLGKGIPGIFIDGLYGFVMRRNLVLQRANNGVFCRRFHFTPAFWTEAGQYELDGANPQPHIKWAQKNGVMVTCNRKVLASFEGLYGRCGHKVFELEALDAIAGADAGPDGQDSGKFRIQATDVRIERYPIYEHKKATAYSHRSRHQGTGHFVDYDDPNNVETVIWTETDGALAGSIDKGTGNFKPAEDYSGWRNDYGALDVVESSGPIFRNTAADPHNYTTVPANKARWGQGSKLTLSAIEEVSGLTEIIDGAGVTQAADNASKRVYDVADATVGSGQKLHVTGQMFRGCNKLVLESGVEQVGWAGFIGCSDEATLNTADEADDDEDGGPGDLEDPPE
jgi:hypothetical protein